MMILSELIQYLYPDLKFFEDYTIQNDGTGQYIAKWNTNKYPKPTLEELRSKESSVSKQYFNDQQKAKRVAEYPKLEDQLDMLWHSMDTGQIPKATEFYTAIKAVKDKYPKELQE